MVRTENFVVDAGGGNPGTQALGNHEVVDTPADVLLAGLEAVGPLGILDLVGIEHTPRVHEPGTQPIGKLSAFLIRET